MRAFLLSLLIMACCASPAADPPTPPAQSEPPSNFDTPISLDLQRASLREALDRIARLSNLNIIYGVDMDRGGILTMSVHERPAGEVLDAVAATFRLKVIRMKDDVARVHAP